MDLRLALSLEAAALEVLVSPVAVKLWVSLLMVKVAQVLELAQLSPTMVQPKLKHAQLFMNKTLSMNNNATQFKNSNAEM